MSPENFIYQNIHKSLYLFYYYQEITNELHTSSVNKSKARQRKEQGKIFRTRTEMKPGKIIYKSNRKQPCLEH